MSEHRAIKVLVPVALLDRAQERHLDVPKLMVQALVERLEATRMITTTVGNDAEDAGTLNAISWAVR